MSLNVSALSDYVNQVGRELLIETFASAPTAKYADVLSGIKYKENLNLINDTMTLQAGGCGGTNAGSTVFSARELQVDSIMDYVTICPRDFETKWTNALMKEGVEGSNEIPQQILDAYVTGKMSHAQREMERITWQGNKSTGSGNLALSNGLLYRLNNTSDSASTVNYSTTGFHVSSAITAMDAMINLVPEDIAGVPNLIAFMSISNAKTLAQALRNANYYNVAAPSFANGVFEFDYPLANVKIVGTIGLNTSASIILTPGDNIKLGQDGKSDLDKLDIYWDKSDRNIKSVLEWKQGATFGRPAYVVYKAA